MKRGLLVGLLVSSWLVVGSSSAEAGVGDWFKNSWEFIVTPVNCLADLGRDLLNVGVNFTVCVLQNVNRNPATLDPLIKLP